MYPLYSYIHFNALCLKYSDLTIEHNKIFTDDQRSVYFKDQFPNVYQEFMKAYTLIPNENNLNEFAKYFKLDENKESKLIKLLKENEIDTLYNDDEYQKIYNKLIDVLKTHNNYDSLNKNRYPDYIIYVYLKLLTQQLEHISDSDKNYLLNHLLYLIKEIPTFVPLKLSQDSESLINYKQLLPKNELETNEYYQMAYDMLYTNYGGVQTGLFDICPLHLTSTQEKNISLNKAFIDSNQISRGNNKKLLSDKNYINSQIGYNCVNNNIKLGQLYDKFIIGDKIDFNYINNEMEKIKNKYKTNNAFDVNLMGDKLYEEISNIYTKLPNTLLDSSYILTDKTYTSLFIVDKDIDRKYFDGKLSYFAKFIISMKDGQVLPNEKICTDYILTCVLNKVLSSTNNLNISLYIMFNYIKDQLDEWLIKIKPLLGLDDEWNYDETKDTIRKKVLTNDPELIEKYDQIMNINYTKIFTLDPLLDKYSNYNIIKTFSDSLDFYISKIKSISSDIESLVVGPDQTRLGEMLQDIREGVKKDITYSNNIFLNTYGFKTYFKNMLKDINSKQSINTYNYITTIFNRWNNYINYTLSSLFNEGIERFYNDYIFLGYQFSRYSNCPECDKNIYKFFTEGFYKVFEEVNILKQYEEMKNKINTTEEDKQITESEEVSLNDIFEDDGVTLKVDLNSIQKPSTYYYTIDEYCEASIELKDRSCVVICQGENQDKKYKRVTIRKNPERENEEPPQQATVELGFNNMISSDSKFIGENAGDIINKMKFYKSRTINPGEFENGKTFISVSDYYYDHIYTVMGDKFMQYNRRYTNLSNSGAINHSTTTLNDNVYNKNILYTSDISDSEYIGEYIISKEDNYVYPIKSMEKLEKIIFTGNNNNYIIYNNIVSLLSKDQYYVRVAGSDHICFSVNNENETMLFDGEKILSNSVVNNPAYKNNVSMVEINNILFNPVIHIEGAKFSYTNNSSEILEYDDEENDKNKKPISKNNTGYVIFRDIDTKKVLLIIITDEEKFKQYISKNIYSLHFDYIYDNDTNSTVLKIWDGYKTNGVKITNEEIINSFLVLNKPEITFKDNTTKQGIPLDNNLVIYDWKYNINNVNIVTLKNNIYKEEMDLIEDQHLQKEFMVKDFNKLMLRKCFPNSFKRTLLCNQDVLDAIDGSKYSIPNIKIKEALCEYGKYPYYLEHYFMTSRVDYKLKGKFNLRCIANLSVLPDIVFEYLDKDDLNYINKEVLVQGEDMIVKDGKIISSGDVYLVGIELSNDMMFKVPPSKILNKTLLNVLDFQQFDNVYSRVELLLDNSGITDYIIKPLGMENIGTLKNMKYINFC